jgi:hypothetical protein
MSFAVSAAAAPESRAFAQETTWEEIAARAPQMVATMAAYLEQISVSHRPSSVEAASLALRHLAAYLTASDPACLAVADITRAHIEGYKVALAARKGKKGMLSKTTIRHNLGMTRTSSSGSSIGTGTTPPAECRSSPATSPKPTNPCPSS